MFHGQRNEADHYLNGALQCRGNMIIPNKIMLTRGRGKKKEKEKEREKRERERGKREGGREREREREKEKRDKVRESGER